jgi:hypothetical protein
MTKIIKLDTKEMCSLSDCNLCQKLNEIGEKIFPRGDEDWKNFVIFGELFHHEKTTHGERK